MTLLAAFQALLARHASQDDLLIGTPVANRNRVEVEGLGRIFRQYAGPPRRICAAIRRSGNCLARTREDALQAFAHQDLPFEHLVEG